MSGVHVEGKTDIASSIEANSGGGERVEETGRINIAMSNNGFCGSLHHPLLFEYLPSVVYVRVRTCTYVHVYVRMCTYVYVRVRTCAYVCGPAIRLCCSVAREVEYSTCHQDESTESVYDSLFAGITSVSRSFQVVQGGKANR